jgi:hypothetical protein
MVSTSEAHAHLEHWKSTALPGRVTANPKSTLGGCLVQYAADLPRVAQGVHPPVTIELKVHSPH